MARIILSPLVDSVRGSLGRSVYSSNYHGPFIREYDYKPSIPSPAQRAHRLVLSQINALWSSLTPHQISSWQSYIEFYSSHPHFSKHVKLSHRELFIQLNFNLHSVKRPFISDPVWRGDRFPFFIPDLFLSSTRIRLIFPLPVSPENWLPSAKFSFPLSHTRNTPGNNCYSLYWDSFSFYLYNYFTAYNEKFHLYPQPGDKIFCLFSYIDPFAGFRSKETLLSTVLES